VKIIEGVRASLRLMFGNSPAPDAASPARASADRVMRASREYIAHQDALGALVRKMKSPVSKAKIKRGAR
jgi:hypothetical protein